MPRPLVTLAAIAALGGACTSTAPPSVVEARVVFRGDAVAGVTEGALAARALERLRQAGAIRVAAGARSRAGVDYRLTIDARLSLQRSAGTAGAVLRAPLSARLVHVGVKASERAIETSAIAERIVAEGEVPDAALLRAHVERAVDDVVDALAVKARVHLATTATLPALIGSSDEDVQAEAIAVAGTRREATAVPALTALLKSDDGEVRDRALGALMEIGDPRAARAITELARLNNQAEMPKIIDALGAIGGDEARSYLQFVVSAHDDEELRGMARAALARMERAPTAPAAPARP